MYPGDAAESPRKETTGMRTRKFPGFVREDGPAPLQGTQGLRHCCLHTLAREFPSKVFHPDERLHDGRAIHVLPLSALERGPSGHQHQRHPSQDHPLCRGAEQICCVGRVVPRGGTELLQHDPFLLLPGTEVSQGDLFPDMPFSSIVSAMMLLFPTCSHKHVSIMATSPLFTMIFW